MPYVTFEGQSGQKYTFEVFAYGTAFNPVGAVYCISYRAQKPDGGFEHTPLYFGETGDLSMRFDNHHQAACFRRHGGNCTLVMRNGERGSRLTAEADLRARWNPPCNEQ